MRTIAKDFGVKYERLQAWNRRRSAPAKFMERLSKPPYSVPADAWKP
jgi:hypothetical protein